MKLNHALAMATANWDIPFSGGKFWSVYATRQKRLTVPPRRNAPPEAVPNLLERVAAQGAENEINLAGFFETLADRP